jgi:hypothetical protein
MQLEPDYSSPNESSADASNKMPLPMDGSFADASMKMPLPMTAEKAILIIIIIIIVILIILIVIMIQ